jgi:hypothetical protein
MMKAHSMLLLLLITNTGTAVGAQASACRTDPDTAGVLVGRLKVAYAVMDTTRLRAQGDPVAVPSDIVLVTDSTTCAAGVTAYNATNGRGVTSAYVVALGESGFVVVDPQDRTGELLMMYVFDSQWRFKTAVGG